jgi:hypothetical protein
MLLPTILFYATLLLPLTMADFQLSVFVPDQWKDIAIVNGKNSSTGVPVNMTRESAHSGTSGRCTSMEGGNPEPCNHSNYGVAKISFSSPTMDPRPIIIALPDYTLQVSIKNLSC